MILTGDYHTHTPYSHGKNTVDENVAKAKEIGLKEVAISDHGFSHVVYGLHRKEVKAYRAECIEAEKKHGIKVLVGIEANIRGYTGESDLTEKDYENFDVYLCGNHVFIYFKPFWDHIGYFWGKLFSQNIFHYTTKGEIKRNTKAYVNVVKRNPIDALTHINYMCPCDSLEVAKCAADYGTYIELNSKKSHFTDDELCNMVQKTQVRFIVNSDAHSAARVGDTKLVDEQLARINFPMDRIDNIDGRFPDFRFAEFKKHL